MKTTEWMLLAIQNHVIFACNTGLLLLLGLCSLLRIDPEVSSYNMSCVIFMLILQMFRPVCERF